MEGTFDDILQPIRTGKLKSREALRPYASPKHGVLTQKKGVSQINLKNLATGKLQNDLKLLHPLLNPSNRSVLDDSMILEDPAWKQSFADYVQEETALSRSQQALTSLASFRNETREGSYKQTAGDVFEETMSQKLQKEFLSTSNPRFRLNSPSRPRLATMAQRAGSFLQDTHVAMVPIVSH
jgi:hypothetical protein